MQILNMEIGSSILDICEQHHEVRAFHELALRIRSISSSLIIENKRFEKELHN
jgi:hypothetical protein